MLWALLARLLRNLLEAPHELEDTQRTQTLDRVNVSLLEIHRLEVIAALGCSRLQARREILLLGVLGERAVGHVLEHLEHEIIVRDYALCEFPCIHSQITYYLLRPDGQPSTNNTLSLPRPRYFGQARRDASNAMPTNG
jgi:hypothetical protein